MSKEKAVLADERLAEMPPIRIASLIRTVLDTEGSEQRDQEVLRAVNEAMSPPKPESEPALWLYGLFKFLIDPQRSKARWEALQAELLDEDRETIVLKLWRLLEAHYGDEVERNAGSLPYHRLWLFDWFVWRYDLGRARRALGATGWLVHAHFVLASGIVALLVLRREGVLAPCATLCSSLAVAFVYGAIVAFQTVRFRAGLATHTSALMTAVSSLVPRLAGASAVGLVALASSEELLRLVVGAGERQLWPLWLAGLILGGYSYLFLEMGRRVHPLPKPKRLAKNGLDILVTALAHGTALALVVEGGLTRILSLGGPFTWSQFSCVVVFIVTIGLIVNLIWAEQPVTEPL